MSITIIQIATTSTSSVMHAMANHYVTIDGAVCVYMHLHFYYTDSHYHTLRKNSNLTSTSSIIIIIRHDHIIIIINNNKISIAPNTDYIFLWRLT